MKTILILSAALGVLVYLFCYCLANVLKDGVAAINDFETKKCIETAKVMGLTGEYNTSIGCIITLKDGSKLPLELYRKKD